MGVLKTPKLKQNAKAKAASKPIGKNNPSSYLKINTLINNFWSSKLALYLSFM